MNICSSTQVTVPFHELTWVTVHSTAQDHGATVSAGTRHVQWPQVLSVEVKVPPGGLVVDGVAVYPPQCWR